MGEQKLEKAEISARKAEKEGPRSRKDSAGCSKCGSRVHRPYAVFIDGGIA